YVRSLSQGIRDRIQDARRDRTKLGTSRCPEGLPGTAQRAVLTILFILRQLRVMQREDPTQNACTRVHEIPRPVDGGAMRDEPSRALSAQASTTIPCRARA